MIPRRSARSGSSATIGSRNEFISCASFASNRGKARSQNRERTTVFRDSFETAHLTIHKGKKGLWRFKYAMIEPRYIAECSDQRNESQQSLSVIEMLSVKSENDHWPMKKGSDRAVILGEFLSCF